MLRNLTSLHPLEDEITRSLLSIKWEYVAIYKIIESRLRDPKRSIKRTIIGDFFRCYYPDICFAIFFSTKNISKAFQTLPSFLILVPSIHSVTDEIIEWVYSKNKYVKSIFMFIYAFFKCVSVFAFLRSAGGANYLLVIFHIVNTQGVTVPVVNIIEDYYLMKNTKLRKEINLGGLLNALNAYLAIILVVLVGDYFKAQGFGHYAESPMFKVDHLMKAG